MRFTIMLCVLLAAVLTTVMGAPASDLSVQVIDVNATNSTGLIDRADAADCPKPTRYACGEFELRGGFRMDFVSQVYKCIPREQFICNRFQHPPYDPDYPNVYDRMTAAKVDPGCTCTFYEDACNDSKYHETWVGWEGEPGKPEWSRAAQTDKVFNGWWCYESY